MLFVSDVLVSNGKIAKIGIDLKPDGDISSTRILNATHMYVMPGGIDAHTHLDMPFMGDVTSDDFYTGHVAAVSGGTTYHIDFALPMNNDLLQGYTEWRKKAEKAAIDYSFHMAVTSWNEKVAQDMRHLTSQGINSFKFFMAYKGALMVTDEQLIYGLEKCKELGALPQVHAENGDAVDVGQKHVAEVMKISAPHGHGISRPPGLEGEATGRAIRLAEFVKVPIYIVHVMSQDAMEEVELGKRRGARVIGETVSSAIALDDRGMWSSNFTLAASMVMSPPLRAPGHAVALKKALAGGILEIVGTDHAPFNSTQKEAGRLDFRKIPNGVNGIEERMHVAWEELVNSGLLTPSDYVRVTSTRAAQVFNIYPRKGVVREGSDADIILLNPHVHHVLGVGSHHYARMDTNVYEGKRIRGKVVTTISRGRVVWDGEHVHLAPGSGRYVELPTRGPLFQGLEKRSVEPEGHPSLYHTDSEGTVKDSVRTHHAEL